MGQLSDFNLDRLIADYGCRALVETGTGAGLGVQFAAGCGFDLIFSIEPSHKRALETALRHSSDHRITIIHAKIGRGLQEVLEDLPAEVPAIFWLNAPPPRKDDPVDRLALEADLRLLAAGRDLSRDIILVNDARLYMDGPFEAGPADPVSLPPEKFRSLNFADEILAATHGVEVLSQGTGILCAFPQR